MSSSILLHAAPTWQQTWAWPNLHNSEVKLKHDYFRSHPPSKPHILMQQLTNTNSFFHDHWNVRNISLLALSANASKHPFGFLNFWHRATRISLTIGNCLHFAVCVFIKPSAFCISTWFCYCCLWDKHICMCKSPFFYTCLLLWHLLYLVQPSLPEISHIVPSGPLVVNNAPGAFMDLKNKLIGFQHNNNERL